jgi:hypothetical protein
MPLSFLRYSTATCILRQAIAERTVKKGASPSMARRQRVTFRAKRKVTKPVKVSFKTKAGQKVSFRARKKVTKRVNVSFLARRKKP